MAQNCSVTQGPALSEEIIISPKPHHLSKFKNPHIPLAICLVSLPVKDSGNSSPVIVIVKSTLCFDIAAEQSTFWDLFICYVLWFVLSSHDDDRPTTRPIASSSGEEGENPHWCSKLHEESDIKMFISESKPNPRLPSPTSFDGVKCRVVRRETHVSLSH